MDEMKRLDLIAQLDQSLDIMNSVVNEFRAHFGPAELDDRRYDAAVEQRLLKIGECVGCIDNLMNAHKICIQSLKPYQGSIPLGDTVYRRKEK